MVHKLMRGSCLLLGGIALVVALSGCSSLEGGDTTCGEYLELSSSDQQQVIRNFLEEQGDSDPAGGEVLLSQQSAKLYCNTIGTASDPISNIQG